MRIAEIENVTNIEPSKTSDSYTEEELEPLLYKMAYGKTKTIISLPFFRPKRNLYG